MLRRLHHEQPASFAFTAANLRWAEAQIAKYPEGRQASAVIPLLWRAQEQEGWISRPIVETVAKMLGMAEIRVLEVATFYFMFQLKPVGSVAHVQVCGTLSCMLCGAEDLVEVCKRRIAAAPHARSADGKFSWEEVECLGACANAPMAQIGKDYYEDLTPAKLEALLDAFARGEVPKPGPQNGRFASEPAGGATTLKGAAAEPANASAALAARFGDTVARILDGRGVAAPDSPDKDAAPTRAPDATTMSTGEIGASGSEAEPVLLEAPRDGAGDDLEAISGVGPKIAGLLHGLGVFHFDQIAAWGPPEIAWVDARLKFKGRIEREGWVEQARNLLAAKEGT